MSKDNEKSNVNWPELKNWLPILSGCLVIAASFFSVRTELAVQNIKIENLTNEQRAFIQRSDSVTDRMSTELGNHRTRISIIESKLQISSIPSRNITLSSQNKEPEALPVTLQSAPTAETSATIVLHQNREDVPVEPTPQPTPPTEPQPTSSPIVELVEQVLRPVQGLLQ